MTPKFRAWLKKEQKMDNEIDHISWLEDELYCIGDGITYMVLAEDLVLMQSTGLKDKNGKEIFEGDVLGTKDGLLNGFIEYREDLGMFVNSLIRYNNFERLCNVVSDREIIGNVYENPEFLVVEDE